MSMKPAQHPTAVRTSELLREAGIEARVVEFEASTRTSAEAAAAIGCSVAEIAKSIVFRGKTSGQAIIAVASGDNRVSETAGCGAGRTLARGCTSCGRPPDIGALRRSAIRNPSFR